MFFIFFASLLIFFVQFFCFCANFLCYANSFQFFPNFCVFVLIICRFFFIFLFFQSKCYANYFLSWNLLCLCSNFLWFSFYFCVFRANYFSCISFKCFFVICAHFKRKPTDWLSQHRAKQFILVNILYFQRFVQSFLLTKWRAHKEDRSRLCHIVAFQPLIAKSYCFHE